MYRPRKVATVLASLGLGVALVGVGVRASYTAGASAIDNANVGQFGCTVSSTDPNAVVNGNSVTITNPPLTSSASGNLLTSISVQNTGTMPAVVHWTEATGGTIAWQPAGRMGYASGTSGDPLSTDLTLQPNASHTYTNGVGFMWAELTNADIGQTATVTYTANCSEVPALVPTKVQFVGAVDGVLTAPTAKQTSYSYLGGSYPHVETWTGSGTLTVASASGWPSSGSFTVVTTGGSGPNPATVTYTGVSGNSFTGLTTTSASTGYTSPGAVVKQVVAQPSLALPSGWQPGDMAISYGLGAANAPGDVPTAPGAWTAINTVTNGYSAGGYTQASYRVLAAGDGNVTFGSSVRHGMVAVYRNVAGIGGSYVANPGNNQYWGCGPIALTNTDGSSVVACFGGDGTGTFNVAGAYGPTAFPGTINRSSGFADPLTGLSDTGSGVKTWTPSTYASGDYAHGGANYGVELLSK